eukprot:m.73976 g.73976  ORF g.73976 m.73976 type:complete len:885 (-) comp12384_c0_seq2:2338-4992(-)
MSATKDVDTAENGSDEVLLDKMHEIERLQAMLREVRTSYAARFDAVEATHHKEIQDMEARHARAINRHLAEFQDTDYLKGTTESLVTVVPRNQTHALVDEVRLEEYERAIEAKNTQLTQQAARISELTATVEARDDSLQALQAKMHAAVEIQQRHTSAAEDRSALLANQIAVLENALDAKNSELAATRQTFDEERETFSSTVEQLQTEISNAQLELDRLRVTSRQEMDSMLQAKVDVQQQLSIALADVDTLRLALKSKQATLDILQQQIAGDNQRAGAESQREAQETQHQHALERQSLEAKITRLIHERQLLVSDMEQRSQQVTDVQREKGAVIEQMASERATLKAELEQQISELRERTQKAEYDASHAKQRFDAVNDLVTRQYQALCQHTTTLDKGCNSVEERITAICHDLRTKTTSEETHSTRLLTRERQLKDMELEVQRLQAQVDAMRESNTGLQSSTQQQHSSLLAAERQLNETKQAFGEVQARHDELVNELTTCRASMSQKQSSHASEVSELHIELKAVKAELELVRSRHADDKKQHEREQRERLAALMDVKSKLRAAEADADLAKTHAETFQTEKQEVASQLRTLDAKLAAATERASALATQSHELQLALSTAEKQLAAADQRVEQQDAVLQGNRQAIEKLEQAKRRLEARNEDLTHNVEELQGQLQVLGSTEHQLSNANARLVQLQQQLEAGDAKLEQSQAQLNSASAKHERELRLARLEVEEGKRQGAVTASKLSTLMHSNQSLEQQLAQQQQRCQGHEQQIAAAQQLQDSHAHQLKQLKASIKQKEVTITALKAQCDALADEKENLQVQCTAQEKRLAQAHRTLLSDIEAQFASRTSSLKALDRAKAAIAAPLPGSRPLTEEPNTTTQQPVQQEP